MLVGVEARKRSSKEKRQAKGTALEGPLCTALNILGGKRELRRDGRAETPLETAVRELDEETAYAACFSLLLATAPWHERSRRTARAWTERLESLLACVGLS